MFKWVLSAAVAATIVVVALVLLIQNSTHEEVSSELCSVAPSSCPDNLRYRTLDGSCNNLKHPEWGMSQSKYARLLPAKYGDGYGSPNLSLSGQPLPNERILSFTLFGDNKLPDPKFTLANMQWGQIVAHDMSRIFVHTESALEEYRCCSYAGQFRADVNEKPCYAVLVPPNDPVFIDRGIECLRFIRTVTDLDIGCNYNGGPGEQMSATTSYLDLSIVYGSSVKQNLELRTLRGGRMTVEERNGRQWLPEMPPPKEKCHLDDQSNVCYLGGDDRVNLNTGLTIVHTMLLREHNRLADALAKLNPHWDDNTLFEEARKINIAQFQYISYYEWMPNFFGIDNMINHHLIYPVPPSKFINDYDPNVNPGTLNEHATAAFRSFHNQIVERLDLFSEMRNVTGSISLNEWLRCPAIIEVDDNFDTLARGLVSQSPGLSDLNFGKDVTQNMFETSTTVGTDLHAHDIHRGRIHGLASYNDMREFCGLRRAVEWRDFEDLIDSQIVQKLQSLYESPDDVDLIIGGSLEPHVKNALAGPTFMCIFYEQFYRTRVGDRYFFENSDNLTGLKPSQLTEIRKASMARIMCDNSNIQTIQPRAFHTLSYSNPLLPCTEIPELDLLQWIDTNN